MAEIEIEIDGRPVKAESTQTIIQVADSVGIYIPRFCYHKSLSIPANCRQCLVEVEKAPKALPACATPVAAGMKVFTKSAKTLAAQRAVMEFLLINHPLDCPICDQGGECELQDISLGYGSSQSRYTESKRSLADQDLGPLIATEMTRCIYCTRCVRFGEEIAGFRELGLIGRGEDTEIDTYVTHAMRSEVSGNIIDLCPVGALTNKPYRFTARPWELKQFPSIAPHDCLGSHINVHTRNGQVMRVVSHESTAINETWLSDRDRFSYTGLYAADRLTEPMIREGQQWKVVSWEKAFEAVANGLQQAIAEHGSTQLGALASPSATLEEGYLLQKLTRALGSPHIDHRLRQMDAIDEAMTWDQVPSLEALEQCDAILLVGSNIRKEQPLAALRVRKAALKGAVVCAINPVDYNLNFNVTAKKIVAPHHMLSTLESLENGSRSDETLQTMASLLADKKKICVIMGAAVLNHPQATRLYECGVQLAKNLNASVMVLTEGANSRGAVLAGVIPSRLSNGETLKEPGLSAYQMLAEPRKAYLLLNVEPTLDMANAALATAALAQASCIVSLSIYRNPVLEQYAHVLLPMAPFTETAGTFVNMMGTWQSFKGVANPYAASRPAWKILRVLGNFLHLEGFDYKSAEEVRDEVRQSQQNPQPIPAKRPRAETLQSSETALSRIGDIPLYAVDSLVRRAEPLQQAQSLIEGEVAAIRLHPDTAKQFGFTQGDAITVTQAGQSVTLPLLISKHIAKEAVWIAGGINATAHLGDLFGSVHLNKV